MAIFFFIYLNKWQYIYILLIHPSYKFPKLIKLKNQKLNMVSQNAQKYVKKNAKI
jgi:hypothetical protein